MPSRFDLLPTPISGLVVIQRKALKDERGFFERFFCSEELRFAGLNRPIIQMNRSLTVKKGTVRGLHFQYPPFAETKIVSCLKGEIFDVAVDIRSGSPTFLRWHGEILSGENRKSLLIPEGFAHGFQTVNNESELLYLHTAAFAPDAEGGLNTKDPMLGIVWPLPISELADRDGSHPFLSRDFEGLKL